MMQICVAATTRIVHLFFAIQRVNQHVSSLILNSNKSNIYFDFQHAKIIESISEEILHGNWPILLPVLSHLVLSEPLISVLTHQLAMELLYLKEYSAARALLEYSAMGIIFKRENTENYTLLLRMVMNKDERDLPKVEEVQFGRRRVVQGILCFVLGCTEQCV